MKRIILISCVSKKQPSSSQAQNLYISPLFRKNLAYAHILKPTAIYILSAKYGLLGLTTTIKPYNETLNTMSMKQVEKWAGKVLTQLKGKVDFRNDEIIFLAGERYRKYLEPAFTHTKVPLRGLGIGRQLQFLSTHI